MEHIKTEIDFTSLEPIVIIDDDSTDADFYQDEPEEARLCNIKSAIMNRIGPDITLIPVRKSPFEIKMFTNYLLHSKNASWGYKKIQESHKQYARLIPKEEFVTSDNYNPNFRRLSLPLEKCPVCKKFFRRLQTHLQKHNIQKLPTDPLSCQYCMKAFNTHSNLSIHMRIHTGDKPYKCIVCLKGFAQSCNLVNHMRVHTGERPFKCPHCDRAFTQSGNLENHVRLHTDEKPFKCHFCDKAFTQSGNLSSHIKNNHKYILRAEPS